MNPQPLVKLENFAVEFYPSSLAGVVLAAGVDALPVQAGHEGGAVRVDAALLGLEGLPVQGCQMAKFDSFPSLDCARVEGLGAQSKERKGSNFAA